MQPDGLSFNSESLKNISQHVTRVCPMYMISTYITCC